MQAGEYHIQDGDIILNQGRQVQTISVSNTGDRPIQIGSHYHFYEVNDALSFDREQTRGFRLNIISGTAVRFEPGQSREVELVAYAGKQDVYGFAGRVMGAAHPDKTSESATDKKVAATSQKRVSRRIYAEHFGPTTGDKVRLADTELWLQVEADLTSHKDTAVDQADTSQSGESSKPIEIKGEEVKFGGGKVIRDGMGQGQLLGAEVADTVITNALVVDYTGIYKADIGIKDGRISAIGKAGNPDIQPAIDIPIGGATEIISGEGKILTAGGVDSHIHFIAPQQCETALMSGVTTMLGGGTGPAQGTLATTCTPGAYHIASMLKSTDSIPMNIGLLGKGNVSVPEPIAEQIEAGAVGLKLHEDWGTTPQAIDN